MSRRSFRPREPVLATVRIGSPFLRPAQRRASRLGADAPSPLALSLSAQTDPRVVASRPARRMRGFARTLACSRPPQLHPAPTRGSPFCEWHRRLALASTRPRSFRCPILCSPRHVCVALHDPVLRAPVVRAPLNVVACRRFGPVLRTVAECSKPFPVSSRIRTRPRLAALRSASPSRARRYAPSLPWPASPPPSSCRP